MPIIVIGMVHKSITSLYMSLYKTHCNIKIILYFLLVLVQNWFNSEVMINVSLLQIDQ